ncbi:MAG: Hsp20/alpha crystallin family protein [Candidatus Polarisedimenticolia bacterium]|nr:Hsp20/alpha crystallin family protein [bacterium]
MSKKTRGAQLEVARIQSEINRLFELLLRLRQGEDAPNGWAPAVDEFERNDSLVLEAALPGVDPATLSVAVEEGELRIVGERRPPAARLAEGAAVVVEECEYGPFARSVPLGASVNARGAKAVFDRGVLRVELPRVENRRGQSVPIAVERA